MFNPYTITLSLFVVAGLSVSAWGWFTLSKARKIQKWPNVGGLIKESSSDSMIFIYTINQQTYSQTMDFPPDITPGLESTNSHRNKYPPGAKVTVFYQPDNPENATLEPDPGKDVWLIFTLGIGATLLGIIFLFFS